ncbi:malonyl-ACP O-methyltransferase BioC [Thioalkalivibrio thiocyanodenitrificans]|uniref:malonyl-ACP O-methyltransferase BioC n=1 Tax=Thioalkalivibrio thiocyanodenitrificans TaxID=243063 RepID=UPI00037B1E73|nr:malonyl-ACP O-methyltransferase BioC [Thioalkalivibrio thiocyanodenitrificans]
MTDGDRYRLDKRRVRATFDRAAAGYDAAAPLQHEICDRLLERLDWVKLAPRHILDAGTGTGRGARGLRRRYPRARLLGLDLSLAMLRRARRQSGWWRRPDWVCADLEGLPLADASLDLLFSSLALQWCNDLERTLRGFRRVLAPGGLLMFTTFGPDTLKELRAAWQAADADHVHVNVFMDMHDIGDALVRAGFADPVMDMEMVTVTYPDLGRLLADLRAIGATNANAGRERGLTTRARLRTVESAYDAFRLSDDRLPATYEVIYGHAWAPEIPAAGPAGRPEGHIPILPRS